MLINNCLKKKSTDRNTLLRHESCHPKKIVKSLPLSQMSRMRHIVNRDYALENMVAKFKQCGYHKELVENHRSKVKMLSRLESFKSKQKVSQKRIPFVSTYSEWSGKKGKIINKHWFIIRDSYRNIEEFDSRPLRSYVVPPVCMIRRSNLTWAPGI